MESSTKILITILVLLVFSLTGLLIWKWIESNKEPVCECPVCEKKKVSDYPLYIQPPPQKSIY